MTLENGKIESGEIGELTEEERKVSGILKSLIDNKAIHNQDKELSSNLTTIIFSKDRQTSSAGGGLQLNFKNHHYGLNEWADTDALAKEMVSLGLDVEGLEKLAEKASSTPSEEGK